MTDARQAYLDEYRRVEPGLPGSAVPWVGRRRADALDWFASQGLPSLRDEEWKYSNPALIERQHFRLSEAGAEIPERILRAHVWPMAVHRLVFVDGRFSPRHSTLLPLPPGVVIGSLRATLEERPAALEPHLGRIAPFGSHGFAALNLAFLGDGAYIDVPADIELETPILLVFVNSGAGGMSFPRNLVQLAEGARATVIEQHVGIGEATYLADPITEIVTAKGAHLDHYKLQQEGPAAFHVGGVHAVQGADSSFSSHSIALGARWSRNDIVTRLDAEGCECTLNGLYLGHGRQHVDHHTRIDHARPRGTSREYYKGVLDDAARGVFSGRVVVHPDAQQTDAQQTNRNLLLSDDAEVDTKPQLEIYADDVKCSHGATIGQLEPEQLFYLQSRGVSLPAARALLTYAFAREVIERVRLAPLRTVLDELLQARLPFGAPMGELP